MPHPSSLCHHPNPAPSRSFPDALTCGAAWRRAPALLHLT
ncbi:Hypothetical protein CAP_6350 [Chondromyces apiculatus DSM 436]|uniref:Uncharacterized protein n=1 Tax=Chondromyces apiculatus DSM 436 TaxID=1192034 RepID=A0A017T1R2_9BACT|nr:Hypothetical protein CAP_6350 [Chondromyces apiculatus DSM 436]